MTDEQPGRAGLHPACVFLNSRLNKTIAVGLALTCSLLLSACAPTPTTQQPEAAAEEFVTKPRYVAAQAAIDDRYRQQIGRTLAPLARPRVTATPAAMNCEFQCDAYTAMQPVLTLRWQPPGTGEAAPAYTDAASVRLDISGTPRGFAEGNFATIQLTDIAEVQEPMQAMVFPPQQPRGQVLLNQVENGRVVERPVTLPLFESASAMARSVPELPREMTDAVMRDLRAGSLSQVRVLGRGDFEWRGAAHQTVSMSGFQPGLTYRVRMVRQDGAGGETLVEQVCRVPVCPSDEVTQQR